MQLPLRQGRFPTKVLPILVWSLSFAAVIYLFQLQSQQIELKGIVFGHEQPINTSVSGYLKEVPVVLFDEVRKGDTVAILQINTDARHEYLQARLAAQRATAGAELERLGAELDAAEERMRIANADETNDVAALARNLAVDVERARIAILEVKTNLEPDRMLLEDMAVEVKIAESLLAEEAIDPYELQKTRTQYAILQEKVRQNEQLLNQAEKNRESAQQRKKEFDQSMPESLQLSEKALAPVREAIHVQELRIAELLPERDVIALKAPFDGTVNSISCRAGEAVMAGQPIMTLVKPRAEAIVAWAPQAQMDRLQPDMKVRVVSLGRPMQSFETHIDRISPTVEIMPQRLWRNPTIPEWGRSAHIPIHAEFTAVVNEVVGVKTLPE